MDDEMARVRGATANERPGVRVQVLGPLTIEHDGRPVHVAGTQRRRLLAFLASRPRQASSMDAIVDVLWPDDPPPSAAKTVQSHVVRLRRSLAGLGELLVTVPGGYRLDVDPADVDAFRFEELVVDGRRQLDRGHPTSARASLAEALGLWRGPAYADALGAMFVDAETVRLDELRRCAVEDLSEADLVSGAAAVAVPELERLVTAEPGRERAWALLMRSLYASGRQRDALMAFERARRVLAESYGLEPGAALQHIQRQVLAHDPDLDVRSSDVGVPMALRATTAFVGRQSELAGLSEAWSVARAGSGQVRSLVGPAGSGRTRLAAALAAAVVADGGAVEYVRGSDGLDALVTVGAVAGSEPVGRVVDAVVDRCRRRPVLVVVDDVEWMPATAVPAVEALADVAAQLSLLLVLTLDQRTGGPAVEVVRRIERASGSAIELPPMDDADLAAIVQADGADDDATAAALAVADGLPGVARREAAAWMERAAGDRLERAAASSLAAASVADDAHATVFDEVLRLVAARAHRDALVSTTWAGRQPYRALASYGPEDADLFVGRERLVAELAARVLDRRLVAVVGASGSGKSSLLRAGLLPLVRSGRLPGTAPWRTNVMVPGTDPMSSLESIEQVDEQGPQLLVVDQFEEIATTGAGVAFGSRLLDLVLDAALDVHVVIVVRADQYGTLAGSRHLAELVEDAQVIVGPPTEEELRRIVTEPAQRTGCAVDPALVDLLVTDVAGQDGTLPLASAALSEVWERRTADTLSAEDYVAIGGLAAAVERLGERAIVTAGDEEGVREVLLRLVDVTDDGQWVRRRIAAADLPERLAGSVDALVTSRLAVRDGGILDVVHEVVFRSWPRLSGWLDDARTDLVIDRDLRVAARSWDDQGRSDDDVYRGARLQAAADWLARSPDASATVIAFVEASVRAAEREHEAIVRRLDAEVRSRRRLSRALVAAGVLLVGALTAGGLAIIGQRRADDARHEAITSAAAENEARQVAEDAEARAEEGQRVAEEERDVAESARLVAESRRALDGEADLATLLAVEAHRRLDTPETQTALLDVLGHNLPPVTVPFDTGAPPVPLTFTGFLPGPATVSPASDIEISGDGRVLAVSGSPDGVALDVVVVYDTSTRTEIGRISEDAQAMRSLDVSDDGRYVLATTFERVHLFDTTAATVSTSSFRAEPDRSITSASFRPSGDQYVITTVDGVITLWDRSTDSKVDVPMPMTTADIAGFAPDGTLAVGQADLSAPEDLRAQVQFWDVDQGVDRGTVDLAAPTNIPTRFTFSPDMRYLAGAADGSLIVWDLATGQITGGAAGRSVEAQAAIFTPISPSALAIGRTDGDMQLYDVAADQPITDAVPSGGSAIVDLAASATGDSLVGLTDQGVVVMWRAPAALTPLVRTIDCCTSEPTWSVLGEHVLAETDDAFVVHDTSRPEEPAVVIDPPLDGPAEIETIEVSADGSVALVGALANGIPGAYVTDLTSGVQRALPDVFGWSASLSADGARIVTMSSDYRTLELWDVEAVAKIAEMTASRLGSDTEFSGPPHYTVDGSAIDVATLDGVARLDADDLTVLSFGRVDSELVPHVVVDVPGTDEVIAIVGDGSLARLDLATREVVATNRTLQSPAIGDVELSVDGVIGGLFDRFDDSPNVQLFDVATLRTIGSPLPVEFTGWTHFSPDGRYLADLLPGGRYRLWDVEPDSWQTSLCAAAGRNLTQQEWVQYIGPDEPYRATCPDWPAG